MRRLLLLLAFIPASINKSADVICINPYIGKIDHAQEKCLSVTIYGEARGESLQGQIAVAYTVLNRAVNRSICQVALSPKQYSIFNNNPALRAAAMSKNLEPTQKNIIDKKSWEQATKVAQMVLANFVKDPTGGATHYLSAKVMKSKHYRYPRWSKEYKMVKEIENHKFYKAG